MDEYYNEPYNEIEERDGFVLERIPRYWNNEYVDEDINVTLQYRASHFKSKKAMYKKIFNDIEKIKESLLYAQKMLEREEKVSGGLSKRNKRTQ